MTSTANNNEEGDFVLDEIEQEIKLTINDEPKKIMKGMNRRKFNKIL